MTDPDTIFQEYKISPADGATGISLTPVVMFNCDGIGVIRSGYNENHFSIRFVVNAETVYEWDHVGVDLWDDATGGSRHNYPSEGTGMRTTKHSPAVWYTLTEGQGDLTYSQTYTWSVDLKYYQDEAWTEVISGDFTTLDETFPPKPAVNPHPTDGEIDVSLSVAELSWEDGGSGNYAATSYDVWFATSYGEDPFVKVADHTTNLYVPFSEIELELEPSTEYSWWVVSNNDYGSVEGDTWIFTTEESPKPLKAITPGPTNGEDDIKFTQTNLTWVDGGTGEHAATSFNVYFEGNPCAVVGTTAIIPSFLLPGVTYSWYVVSINGGGSTIGDTWTFTVNDDPIANIENGGDWHPDGTYTFDIYTPDENVTTFLADNDSGDITGEISGSEINIQGPISDMWTRYSVKIPKDCETGTLYIKWHYNG